MTGKEKVQLVLDVIKKKYEELISGNVINVGSYEIYQLSIDEQKEVLDILVKNKQINFEATSVYSSFDDIEPKDILEANEIASIADTTEEEQIDELLKLQNYRIEILSLPQSNIVLEPEELPTELRKSVVIDKLGTDSYNKRSGVLTLSPTLKIDFSNKGKVRRTNGKKYMQPELLELVFKNVNTLSSGVSFSRFLGVKYDKKNKNHKKKIDNTIDEINKKVSEKNGPRKLIFLQGEKIYIDKSYL